MWTYSEDPQSSSKDRVRFLVGDTLESDPLVSDEEIAAVISQNPNVYMAASIIAEAIAAKYARQVDNRNADLSVSASQRSKAYLKLAQELKKKALTGLRIYAGGCEEEVSFKKGMHDF